MMDDSQLYHLLCCPACRGGLEYRREAQEFYCGRCRFTFPIVDGIPVLFPCDTKSRMDELFGRYWDAPEKAQLYDANVEGAQEIFGTYNHEAEIFGIVRYYDPENLDMILDAGCGNGRFMQTFPEGSVRIGLDASLNLLRITKQKLRTDLLVCGELEHIPFKNGLFGTVISCRVLQHLRAQEAAVREMARVVREGGDVILELYNRWNLKTIYKNIRMSPTWSRIFNAPFRVVFRSMSPFAPWGLVYDRYSGWFEVKRFMARAGLTGFQGRGVGFGYHKYLFQPFYIDAVLNAHVPNFLPRYYNACFAIERAIGGLIPLRYGMEKFVIKARRGGVRASLWKRAGRRFSQWWKRSRAYNAAAVREVQRERARRDVVASDDAFHMREALEWLKRAQDATPDGGVSRGYSVGWSPYFDLRGWQPSYPETTGYIIPTVLEAARVLGNDDLRTRAIQMADWEVTVQMECGAVMGGTVDQRPSPAIFNTGQVILGWLRVNEETKDGRYLEASERAARFLLQMQSENGAWQRGNSRFASDSSTTYNSRVGWALMLHGLATGEQRYVDAGTRNMAYTLSQQQPNGWFANNCLTDPSAPLLHTICYALEGLLGAYRITGVAEYLQAVERAIQSLVRCVGPDGAVPGRLDASWNAKADWSCLTGNAQLANILLALAQERDEHVYADVADRLLTFIKRTQNCVADDPGLRGGIKGSHPFDGEYGRFEVLNWPTKFFVDALLLRRSFGRPARHVNGLGAGTHVTKRTDT